FILISGDSGVGKSSFVDAGLLPRLEKNGLPDGQNCLCVRMVPSQGHHPFDALLPQQAGLNACAIGGELVDKPEVLSERIEEIIAKGAGGKALVLFLDQMEELFTSHNREHTAAFITALFAAVQQGVLWVVATIRNDHLQHCYSHEELLQVLRGPGHYALGQVDPSAIVDIIKKPAQCAGLDISDRLALRIARESGSESGILPLLAFVLQQLFDQRRGRALSEQVYDDIGGVAGAVSDHVKNTEQKLRREIGADAKDLLPKLFQVLLVVDSEGLPTRRRARRSDFADDLAPLVDRL
ncbi:MAG: ATP-binding protein, partial [Deltaproteobacteria bacterium]|nr:ATP-binding protein [Deltaproteobacteria bacterium]